MIAGKCLAGLITVELMEEEKQNRKGKTRQWIKRQDMRGYFKNIVKELSLEDTSEYHKMMRMNHRDFVTLLSNIGADITPKQVLDGHKVISGAEGLTLTISFLATWETYRSLSYHF